MVIRKEIKSVLRQYNDCEIDQIATISAISTIVNRPKPEPLDPILTAQDAVGECTERTGPQSTKPVDPEGPHHDVFTLTLTHFCDADVLKCHIDHDQDVSPELLAEAIRFILEFAKEELGVEMHISTYHGPNVAELLKKF